MKLDVQELDQRIFTALGIRGRSGFRPVLRDDVLITVNVPLGIGAEAPLGFNDGETDAGSGFVGYAVSGAVAGNRSHVQVKNPAGSGKVWYLDEVTVLGLGAARGVQLNAHDADIGIVALAGLYSRLQGGAASTTQLRTANNVGILGTLLEYRAGAANIDITFPCNPPYRLDAGKGVLIGGDADNVSVNATFRGREYFA